jgi:hypothetical protein
MVLKLKFLIVLRIDGMRVVEWIKSKQDRVVEYRCSKGSFASAYSCLLSKTNATLWAYDCKLHMFILSDGNSSYEELQTLLQINMKEERVVQILTKCTSVRKTSMLFWILTPCGLEHRRRTVFFSEFFGFPLSVSFHRGSTYSYIIWGMKIVPLTAEVQRHSLTPSK